jgi:hypothetical protein
MHDLEMACNGAGAAIGVLSRDSRAEDLPPLVDAILASAIYRLGSALAVGGERSDRGFVQATLLASASSARMNSKTLSRGTASLKR